MSREPDVRLQRLLGGAELAELRRRLRRHFQRAQLDGLPGTIRLGGVTPREYAALASLMGRPQRQASSIQVDVAQIDVALRRAGIAPTLRAVLEALDGPIVHLPTARAEAFSRWVKVAESPRHPGILRLLQSARGLGLLKRLARQDPAAAGLICSRADLVLQRLPVQGRPRAQLAAEALGDAHALDGGEPTATLVLAVLRQSAVARNYGRIGQGASHSVPSPLVGEGQGGGDCRTSEGGSPPTPSPSPQGGGESGLACGEAGDSNSEPMEEDDRTLWARAGVLVNELARPALLLNLPMEGGGTFAGDAGEPSYATLRQLLRSPPRLAVSGRIVYVCENPNLVAIAADRLSERCAPLVCTDGMPAAAQRTLLARLVESEAQLAYHGDFDWPGLRIASFVMRSFGARPWRFDAGDYMACSGSSPGLTLAGTSTSAFWDPSLATTMRERGLAVPEEAVAATLLQDLQR